MINKIKKLTIILLTIIILSGCTNKETKLCNKSNQLITDYTNGSITYEELVDKLKKYNNKYCKSQENDACSAIEKIIDQNDKTYELKDCSGYEDDTQKRLCEATNNLTQSLMDGNETLKKAQINELTRSCLENNDNE